MSDLVENILKEIENKNYGLAIELCDKLISHQPNNENIYEIKAGCYSALKDYKKAADCYGNAVDIAVMNKLPAADISRLHIKKGKSHLKLSEVENAAREFKSALDYSPDSGKANNDYSAALRRLDLCEEALEFADKAVMLNPGSPEFLNNRGNIYYCLGRTEESIRDYSRAIELKPDYPNAYFNRGSVYFESLNDRENAKKDWLKAIELNPHYKEELMQISSSVSELLAEMPEKKETGPENYTQEMEIAKTDETFHSDEPKPDESDNKLQDISSIADKITVVSLDAGTKNEDEKPDAGEQEKTEPDEPQEEERKTLSSAFEETDLAKVTDLFGQKDVSSETNKDEVAFSDYSDIFDKETPKDQVSKTGDDFMLPEFDFKSIFKEYSGEDEKLPLDEIPDEKPVQLDELKGLHDEIQKQPESEEGISGINPEVKPFGEIYQSFPESAQQQEKQRHWYTHPVFWIIIVVIFVLGGLIAGYNYLLNTGNFLQQQLTQADSTLKLNTTPKDSSAPVTENKEQKSDTATKTEQKTDTEKKTAETKQPESKFLGYLTDKQKFALFSEPDGYYVQIGSYKDRAAANEHFGFLKKNNIKGSVFEANLGEKGVLFRVRAGAFESQEKAREVMSKFE